MSFDQPSTDSAALAEWLKRIAEIHPVGWDLGLSRVAEVGQRLDVLKPAPTVILVAGTNGKGSTCEYLSQLAATAGLRRGKSTSPHLFRFAERIEVDGRTVSDELIVDAFERIDIARGETTLTYFEFATLASLLIFTEAALDVAILEIGLGGRLDAMNIVDPDLSIITAVSLDHEAWLGDTREKIGKEKAGIMRAGVPCVVTDTDPTDSVLATARSLGITPKLINRDFLLPAYSTKLPPASFAGALAAAEILGWPLAENQIEKVAIETALPGRLTTLALNDNKTLVIDVGHNPEAATYLAERLADWSGEGSIRAVFSAYGDKDLGAVAGALGALIESWYIAPMDDPRGASVEQIRGAMQGSVHGLISAYDRLELALEAAISEASAGDTVVAFGSFVVAAEAMRHLNGPLMQDQS